MKKLFSFSVFIILMGLKMPSLALVEWGSTGSNKRIEQSEYKVDFYKLVNHFEPQSNKIFCGPTSAVIVLNALRLRNINFKNLPLDKSVLSKEERKYIPDGFEPSFQRYTQNNIFEIQNNRQSKTKVKHKMKVLGKPNKDGKKDFGFQLRQYKNFLESHGLNVQMIVASSAKLLEEKKHFLLQNLKNPNDYILVNYSRKVLGQEGGGHISPIGAYDKETDSFLILDVNPNKAPWVWVPWSNLKMAMATMDTIENRGFLLVKEK